MKFKLLVNPQKKNQFKHRSTKKMILLKNSKKFVLTNASSNQLLAYDDKDVITLSLDKIALITIIDNKTYAICTNKKQYQIKKRIYQLVEELPKYFWRVNKSSIVNRYQISRFEETQTASVNIIMKNGLTDYVSRRCFAKIRKELG